MTFDKVTSEVSVSSITVIIIHSSPGNTNSIAQ